MPLSLREKREDGNRTDDSHDSDAAHKCDVVIGFFLPGDRYGDGGVVAAVRDR